MMILMVMLPGGLGTFQDGSIFFFVVVFFWVFGIWDVYLFHSFKAFFSWVCSVCSLIVSENERVSVNRMVYHCPYAKLNVSTLACTPWLTPLRIMGSQNRWFGDPRTLLYRVEPLHRRVQWFLGWSIWLHVIFDMQTLSRCSVFISVCQRIQIAHLQIFKWSLFFFQYT